MILILKKKQQKNHDSPVKMLLIKSVGKQR